MSPPQQVPDPRQEAGLPPLPTLTTSPRRHPDCCLSLSTTLLQSKLSHIQAATPTSTSISSPSPSPSPPPSQIDNEDRPRPACYEDVIISIGSGSGLLEACLQQYISTHAPPPRPQQQAGSHIPTTLCIKGVEVKQQLSASSAQQQQQQQQQGLNRYLPEHSRELVRGTWEVWPGILGSPDSRQAKDRGDDSDAEGPHGMPAQRSKADGGGRLEEEEEEEEEGHRKKQRPVALMFVYPRLPALVRKYAQAVLSADPGFTSPSSLSTSVKVIIYLGPRVDWPDFQPCFERSDDTKYKLEIKIIAGEEAGLLEYEMMAVVHIR